MSKPTPPELLKVEAARLKALTVQAEAETRRTLAEAVVAEQSAVVATLEAADAARVVAERDASDIRNHIYHFAGPVMAATVAPCQRTLSQWSRLDPGCPITVVFNSPGGSVIDGMALFDFLLELRGKGHKLTTVCRGYAASMAGILLQAGDTRVMGRESYLMIHELSAGTHGKIGEMEDAVKFYQMICKRVVGIFVDRSGKKCSEAVFKKNWTRADWWLDSVEALRLGFVDEIA